MNENQQIIYMQARLVRLAAEEWNMSIRTVISIFTQFKVLQFKEKSQSRKRTML